jgi:hypothetical protein
MRGAQDEEKRRGNETKSQTSLTTFYLCLGSEKLVRKRGIYANPRTSWPVFRITMSIYYILLEKIITSGHQFTPKFQ